MTLATTLAALWIFALAAPLAGASSGQNAVIADCLAHPSGLTGNYTVSQLTHALNTMSPETKEYTSCPDVISRARLAAIAHGGHFTGPGTSSSSSFLPTPVIVILVLLVLAAVTFGAIAIRRRQAGSAAPGDDPPDDGDGHQGPDA